MGHGQKKKSIIFFDIETFQQVDKNFEVIEICPYLIGWVDSCNDEYFHHTFNEFEFFKFLLEKYKTHKLTLCAYNATYDLKILFGRLINYLIEIGYKRERIKYIFQVDDRKKIVKFRFNLQKILSFNVSDPWRWIKERALKDYMFGELQKGKIDYDKNNVWIDRTKNLIYWFNRNGELKKEYISYEVDYLKKDVYGLIKAVQIIKEEKKNMANVLSLEIDKVEKINSGSYGKMETVGSFAKLIFDRYLLNKFNTFFRPCLGEGLEAKNLYDKFSAGSCGGWTSRNPNINYYEGEIEEFDINSQYPFQLIQEIPSGMPIFEMPHDVENYFEMLDIEWENMEWLPQYYQLGKEPFFKNFCGVLPKMFVNWLKTVCTFENIKVMQTIWMKKSTALEGPIMHCYQIKSETLDPDLKKAAKLTMNSLYGKTLQQTYQTSILYKYCEDAKEWVYEEDQLNPQEIKYYSPLVGVWVICFSRVHLISNIIKNIKLGHTFLYGDTDSAKMGKKEGVDFVFPMDETEIGMFKHEGYKNIYCNNGKLKSYFLGNTKTGKYKAILSGMDKQSMNIIKSKFKIKHWISVYDPNNNYCFLESATRIKLTKYTKSDIITKSDFQFNRAIKKITHTVNIKTDPITIINLKTKEIEYL